MYIFHEAMRAMGGTLFGKRGLLYYRSRLVYSFEVNAEVSSFLKFEIHHGVYVQYVFLVYHFHDYVFLLALSESKW